MATFKTFKDLACYRMAREFRKTVSEFCRTLPKEETYRLKDQFIRASRSAAANIAEGFGRHHHQENAQYCRHARGSLFECIEHLAVALDEEYLKRDEYDAMRVHLDETIKILNGYIAYLQRCARHGVPAKNGQSLAESPITYELDNSATQQSNNLTT